MRVFITAVLTTFAMVLGSYLGGIFSYWFAPDIMRMYLSWGEYFQRLPEQMIIGDPLAMTTFIAYSHLLGAFSTTLLTLYLYSRFRHRKS